MHPDPISAATIEDMRAHLPNINLNSLGPVNLAK